MGTAFRLALGFTLAVSATADAAGGKLTPDQFNLLADRLTRSDSYKVRLQAAFLLGAAGGPEGIPLLTAALRGDGDEAVRSAAALALGMTADPQALGPLTEQLGERDSFLRVEAEKGLAQLAASLPEGSLQLWTALEHSAAPALAHGVSVLGAMGAAGVPGLCAAVARGGEETRALARAELSRLRGDQLDAGLRVALRLKDTEISPVAAAMLGDRGDPTALPLLADSLVDPTEPLAVQAEARSALLRLSEGIDPAAEGRRFESDDPQERIRAVTLLSLKGGPRAEALALQALRDPSLRVQAVAASDLADLGATRALPELKAMLDREDEAPIYRVVQIAVRRLERRNAGDAPASPPR